MDVIGFCWWFVVILGVWVVIDLGVLILDFGMFLLDFGMEGLVVFDRLEGIFYGLRIW